MKAELKIARMRGGDDTLVRIDVMDGRTLLSRTEMTLEQYAKATMGELVPDVDFTTERQIGPR